MGFIPRSEVTRKSESRRDGTSAFLQCSSAFLTLKRCLSVLQGALHVLLGYGAFSVSKSGLADVIAYIENQREHHKKISYQDEFLMLLKRYEIEFDPKYVFEQDIVGG